MANKQSVEELAEQIKKLPSAGFLLVKIRAATTDEQREKAYDEAREFLKLEGMMNDSEVDYIGTIRESSADIDNIKFQIKTKKEMLDEHVQQKPEWLEYESKKEETAIAKAKLDAVLKGDADYNNSLSKIAELKDDLKDKQDTLSTFIVGYHAETKETQVEIGDKGDARQLVIKGRLGKKQKYQLSLLGKGEQ